MKPRHKILIIDDDPAICDFVEEILDGSFEVLKATTVDEGYTTIRNESPDLLLLDLVMKDLDVKNQNGLDVCAELKKTADTRHLPVMMYSGSNDIEHLSEAFAIGADDYILKTMRPKEIVARVTAKLRQREATIASLKNQDLKSPFQNEALSCGNLRMNLSSLEVHIDAKPVQLSVLEFNLLRFFVCNPNRVMSREQILKGVWNEAKVSDRTIDTHMVYLRKKLSGFNQILGTVYGAGYILRASQEVTEIKPYLFG